MKTYSDKLKDPRWQKKRLEIMERDDFQCKICGDKETTLNAHHIHYIEGKEIWDYDNKYFVTMCDECHKPIREIKKKVKEALDMNFISEYELTFVLELLKKVKNIKYPPDQDAVLICVDLILGELGFSDVIYFGGNELGKFKKEYPKVDKPFYEK